LRVNEWRCAAFVRPHDEADPKQHLYSNLRAGELVVDTAVSNKKSEVVEVFGEDLEQSGAVAVEKLDDAGVV
jgi:hypothetical protein